MNCLKKPLPNQIALVLAISISSALLMLTSFGCTRVTENTAHSETAMDRILKTGKIRCSYAIYSSYFRKDPNTGKLSGIFHDVMEEIGKNSGLKIDWVEEVGYVNIFPGLQANRCDVFCGGLWPNATRAKAGSFTIPINYSAITTWGRPDDKRFDRDLNLINSPSVRIATLDGAMEDLIAKSDFPKARRISLPELSSFALNLTNIATNKADVTFAEPMVVNEFLKTNPGALRQIQPDKPLRIFGNSLVVKRGELELRDFLDVALREVLNDGVVDKILAKYDPGGMTFHPVASPYKLPQGKR
jgi:ABC-type amino acid transport substrate-binding protein